MQYNFADPTEQVSLFTGASADPTLISQHNSLKTPNRLNGPDSDFSDALHGGIDVTNSERLQRKAHAKYITDHLAKALSHLDSPLQHSYNRTLHCADETYVHAQSGKCTKYCRNRWCLTCNRIRTAQLIDQYTPILNTWGNVYFVTLTVPNCEAYWLHTVIEQMRNQFKNILQSIKRTHGIKAKYLRKLECTYNVDRGDYHPHFHIMCNDLGAAKLLYNKWLERFPEASDSAQDLQLATEGSIKELFKYFAKIFTTMPDGSKAAHVEMLDQIFQAMYKKRTFETYGFQVSDYEDEIEAFQEENEPTEEHGEADELAEQEPQERPNNPSDGLYKWDGDDWVHWTTGEALSGYHAGDRVKKLIGNILFHGRPFYPPD